jgi:hypothetical protein
MFHAIGKLLHWIWSGLDGLRKVLHLLLMLLIFGTLWAAFSRSIPLVPDKAALVIAPQGPLVEQLAGDPFERARAELALASVFKSMERQEEMKRLLAGCIPVFEQLGAAPDLEQARWLFDS